LIAGCGYGIMAAERLLRFPEERLTGIDADPRKIRVAAGALRGFPQASFVCGDLREADLGSHELVTAVDLLHYFPEQEHRAMLERLAAAVAPGGALLFRDGCRDRDGHQIVARWERIAIATRFTRSRAGLHFQTESGWRNLMERCGLVVETSGAGPGSNVILLCRKPNS
ncbi:MAG: methyltransferase domain-containing protein, partial [Planctomycetota bacterium]